MADGWTNIDLVFRNGLKDYEVTPPPDVWLNMQPAINKKKKYMFFLRAAASVAILVSTALFGYWWGYETSKVRFSADVININIDNEPVTILDISVPLAIAPDIVEVAEIPAVDVVNESEQIPVVAQLEIPEIIFAEELYIEEVEEFAEIESFPEIREPLRINNAIVFSSAPQSIIHNIYESAVNMEDNRWSVLAMASPMYQSQFTTSNSSETARQIRDTDRGRASYSGGVGFAYRINNRLSIQSGFYYSAMGKELSHMTLHSGFQQVNTAKGSNNFKVLTSNGTIYANNPDIFIASNIAPGRVQTHFTQDVFDPNKGGLSYLSNSIFRDENYIELPMKLRFKAIDRKIGVSFVGGVSYNFLISSSVYTIANGDRIPVGPMEGLNSLSLSSSLGMGMEYKFSRNISFNVEPTFRYFIRSANIGLAGLHNYAIGVYSGMSYRF